MDKTLVQWHTEDEAHVLTWHEVGETGDYKTLLDGLAKNNPDMVGQYESLLSQGTIINLPQDTPDPAPTPKRAAKAAPPVEEVNNAN